MIIARKVAIVALAGPLRQFHVEGLQDLAHGHRVPGAACARGVEVAARDAWDV